MKITILGSGGFQTIPRPLCQCRICLEARNKGLPYTRSGPAIYVRELQAIFDTPKDIVNSLNRENVKDLNKIFYTHWHPDHTEGLRVVEEITSTWSDSEPFELKNHGRPIDIYIPESLTDTLTGIRSPHGSYLNFFESQNFAKLNFPTFDQPLEFGEIKIIPQKINETTACYTIQTENEKAVYMPCDVKPFDNHEFLTEADLFIVGSPFLEANDGLKNIPKNHPLRQELFSMEEIIDLIQKFKIKQTVITHIEEMWRWSYDEYLELEKKHQRSNIKFAFDGLNLKI